MEENQTSLEELNQQDGIPAQGDQMDSQLSEQSPSPVEKTHQPEVKPAESDQERNLAALRQARERAERERDQLAQQLQQMQQQKPQEEPYQDYSVAPDALVEGKHLSKYDREIKALREELHKYQQQTISQSAETRLKTQYPDFDKVVSAENINALRESHPEIAQTLSTSSDLYNQGASAYKVIKSLGIYREDTYAKDRQNAHVNANKPRPLASVAPSQGDSPLSNANAFATGGKRADEMSDHQKQLFQEMQELRKNY